MRRGGGEFWSRTCTIFAQPNPLRESEKLSSELANLSPVTVCGEVLPPPQLFRNIPMLHWILQEVLEDWLRAVKPCQMRVDNVGDNSTEEPALSSANLGSDLCQTKQFEFSFLIALIARH